MEDSAVRERLAALIEDATDPERGAVLDAQLLYGLKTILRTADEYVSVAFDVVFTRLLAPHAQTRLLAVQLADDLFMRSRTFRNLLIGRFRQFLEVTIGYRNDLPLPGPPSSATVLRSQTLAIIERWRESFGQIYPQIIAGHRYLAILNFKFPEIRARAAMADTEREARTARTQQLLREKAAAAAVAFPELQGYSEMLLQQMAECFELLGLSPSNASSTPTAAAAPPASGAAQVDDDTLEWEDVGGTSAQEDRMLDDLGGRPEGLSEYAALVPLEPVSLLPGEVAVEQPEEEVASKDVAVLDTLGDLARQLMARCMPQCQEWLRILVQVLMPAPLRSKQVDLSSAPQAEAVQRARLLNTIIGLRNRVQAAITQARLLGARVQPVRPNPPAADIAAACAAVSAAFGSIGTDDGIAVRLENLQALPPTSAFLGTLGGSGWDSTEVDDADLVGSAYAGNAVGSLSRYQAAQAARRGRGGGRVARKRLRTPVVPAGSATMEAGEGEAGKKQQQRALERAHNEAAISGVGDAALARRLQDVEQGRVGAAVAAVAVQKGKRAQTPGQKLRKLLLGKK